MATGRGAAIGVAPHSQSYPHPLSLSASFPSITTFSLSRRHSFSLSSTKEKKPRVNLLLGSAAEPTTTSSPSSSLQNDATFVSDTEFSLAKYAELKPVPCLTYSDAQLLRENCATPILKQVRNDVIRYRYGDEQHLEEALKRIFQYGQGGGIQRRNAPKLKMIREEATEEGKYCLALVFEAKALQLSDFEQRQAKFASFFGPGITAEVGKGEEEGLYEVKLISDTTL
ncbi:uncharacterized protein LOC18436986 isoform X5 [Amborella trichopoda]|uniref:uncharacterized protein LOC18436986 isoform X5 n=1 Tax=Amborella trichopoda TaxID=13333 RepID=UPI0005D3E827|nr:uncharacterized protein LOC18436986 isoform X5 [Amborella trichopoda]|eukprot:XP_011624430.1 uncharacterized protein LOC18436986 isoform X5 [Amborella trichopoda]